MKSIYEIPASVKEIFDNKETSYRIIDYGSGMDMNNIAAMTHFLDCVGVPVDNIDLADGTQVFLKHPDYDYLAVIDCSGLGDFFSHLYEVSFVKKDGDNYEPFVP